MRYVIVFVFLACATVPTPPVMVNISNQAMNLFPHLSSPNLTCVVDFDSKVVNIELMLTVEWIGPETSQLNITTMVNITPTELPYKNTIQLSQVRFGKDNGNYTCRVTAESNVLQEFITNSETGSDTVTIDIEGIEQ